YAMQSGPTTNDPSLQGELKAGEQVLWQGKPDLAHMVKTGNPNVPLILVNSVLAIILLAVTLFLAQLFYEESVVSRTLVGTTLLLVLICILSLGFCLYAIYRLFKQRWQTVSNLKKTLYAITNQRVIVITPRKRAWP
ncbi:MAG: hypothetical protein M3Z08_19845, partial [Chloroflexota bacterium]|nr:hypothetical protein [Chloroflexota bacterium]